jgi:hypothetical protein
MKQIPIILLVIISYQAIACSCSLTSIKEVRDYSIKNSDLIFIGEIIKTDTINSEYSIRVIEVFKGVLKDMVIGSPKQDSTHYSSCSFWPNSYWGDQFIFYANYVKGTNKIFVDQCSATRSISNPQIHLSYFSEKYDKMQQGTLYKEMTFDEKMKSLEEYNKLKQIAFKDLHKELRFLKKIKH